MVQFRVHTCTGAVACSVSVGVTFQGDLGSWEICFKGDLCRPPGDFWGVTVKLDLEGDFCRRPGDFRGVAGELDLEGDFCRLPGDFRGDTRKVLEAFIGEDWKFNWRFFGVPLSPLTACGPCNYKNPKPCWNKCILFKYMTLKKNYC